MQLAVLYPCGPKYTDPKSDGPGSRTQAVVDGPVFGSWSRVDQDLLINAAGRDRCPESWRAGRARLTD
jgi:hypothetical protein